jgi:hypothetical protein
MMSEHSESQVDWHEIAEHVMTLTGGVGSDAPSIRFVTNCVLAPEAEIHRPAAIAFDTTICIPCDNSERPLRQTWRHGFYGSLDEFWSQLRKIRAGTAYEACLSMTGLDLKLYHDARGRSDLVAEVTSSSFRGVEPWPKREREIGESLRRRGLPASCLHFAFLVPLIDPPCLDRFIDDIGCLLNHLQQFAE